MPHVKFSSPALPSVYFRLTRLSKGEQLFRTATLEGKASWRRWDTTTCTSRDSSEHFWTVRPWRLRVVAIGYTHKKWWKSREKAGGMTPLFEKCFSFFSDAVRRSDERFRKSWPTPPQTLTILLLTCFLQVPQVEGPRFIWWSFNNAGLYKSACCLWWHAEDELRSLRAWRK